MLKAFNSEAENHSEVILSEESVIEPGAIVCVDLDGTLVFTDTLVEAVFAILRQRPWSIFSIFFWLFQGRLVFKKKVFKGSQIDPELLPYNNDLIAWLKTCREKGATIVMATASRAEVAEPIANHLGIFSEVLTSTDDFNLKGANKAKVLADKYGAKGFSYVGDHEVDLPVWAESKQAHICARNQKIVKRAEKVAVLGQVFDAKVNLTKSLLRALRPHQWAKNSLIFLPAIMAHQTAATWVQALMAFVAFCCVASAIYVVNDIADIPSDRKHPDKCKRPFAAGDLDLRLGAIMFPVLAIAGLAIGVFVNTQFFTLLVGYAILTNVYTFVLKKIAIADVLTLSSLYTLRIIAGGVATATVVSNWLMTFSLFLFLSLAFMKRVSEVKLTMASFRRATRSRDHRLKDLNVSGRDYLVDDLVILTGMGTGSGFIAVLVFALYISTLSVRVTYAKPDFLWFVCPVMLFWICRSWLLTHRGQMHSDPVAFAIKDKASLVTLSIIGLLWLGSWWQP